jgi:fumarylacetoacetate (FAA) hydrolase family protein
VSITGRDGFTLQERGRVGEISRDPAAIVAQMIGAHHQYPDGAVLFLGTPFSPVKDRGAPAWASPTGRAMSCASPRRGSARS